MIEARVSERPNTPGGPFWRVEFYAPEYRGALLGILLMPERDAHDLAWLVNHASQPCPNCGALFGEDCRKPCPGRVPWRALCRGCGAGHQHANGCPVGFGGLMVTAADTWPDGKLGPRGQYRAPAEGTGQAAEGTGQAAEQIPGQLSMIEAP